MDRKGIVRTYADLMAVAWLFHLKPRLQLVTKEGSTTLELSIKSVMWPFVDANVVTLFTMLVCLMWTKNKWVFAGGYFLPCAFCYLDSTVLNLVELQIVPAMLEADNYFSIHVKMIIIFGIQFLVLIEVGYMFSYALDFKNEDENEDENGEQEQEQQQQQQQQEQEQQEQEQEQ